MTEPSMMLCPLLNQPCRKDCAWCIAMDVLTDDWAGKQFYCSVNMIASHLDGAWAEWKVDE